MSKNEEAVSEDGDESPQDEPESKNKKSSKKGRGRRSENENSCESGESSNKKPTTKPMSIALDRLELVDQEEPEGPPDTKIPLLDQPAIIEGSRNRKTIDRFERKGVQVQKRSSKVEIPNGKGRALGRITNVYTRLKKLDGTMIKLLHRALFGKSIGNMNSLLNNVLEFRGFIFAKDSDEYKSKIIDLSEKFALSEMRSLMYVFDIDAKYKSKNEAVTFILDFLLCPTSLKLPKTSIEGHPRRKATKRNYFEDDLGVDNPKKRMKKKKKKTEESENHDSSEKNKSNQSSKRKNNAEAVDETSEQPEKGEGSEAEKDNESKKPAKKRKRNQVIDENGKEEEPLSSVSNGTEKPAKDATKKKSRSKRGSS